MKIVQKNYRQKTIFQCIFKCYFFQSQFDTSSKFYRTPISYHNGCIFNFHQTPSVFLCVATSVLCRRIGDNHSIIQLSAPLENLPIFKNYLIIDIIRCPLKTVYLRIWVTNALHLCHDRMFLKTSHFWYLHHPLSFFFTSYLILLVSLLPSQ